MRRISTNYTSRLPDDFVAVVLTEEEVVSLIECAEFVAECIEPSDRTGDKIIKIGTELKKLTEGDKWSES